MPLAKAKNFIIIPYRRVMGDLRSVKCNKQSSSPVEFWDVFDRLPAH